jgi:hypothetical protein
MLHDEQIKPSSVFYLRTAGGCRPITKAGSRRGWVFALLNSKRTVAVGAGRSMPSGGFPKLLANQAMLTTL